MRISEISKMPIETGKYSRRDNQVLENEEDTSIVISKSKKDEESFHAPAYRVFVTAQGRDLALLNKTINQKDRGNAEQNHMAGRSVEQMDMAGIEPLKPLRAEDLDWATQYERASLAETMAGIEDGIRSILKDSAKNPLAVGADIQMYLVRQLNAYGHHQKSLGHSLAGDPYLNSVLDRLGSLDPNCENPLVNEIRSLVGMTMSGKDIELFKQGGHGDLVRAYCAYLGLKMGDALKVKDKASRYFNEKTAAYGFFQEMSRKAKNMEELLSAMLGEDHTGGKKDKKADNPTDLSQLIAEKKTDLDDGMKAYKKSLRILHRIADDKGEGEDGKLSEREQAEEKKRLIPSVTGFDWDRISEQYLKENPELAAIFSDNGMQ